MIRKLGLGAVFLLFFSPILNAVENRSKTPDVVGYTQYRAGVTTSVFRIDFDGNLMPGRNQAQDVGESSHSWRAGYFRNLSVDRGLVAVKEYWGNIPPNNDTLHRQTTISTNTLFSAGTTWITADITQSTVPRNVVIFSSFAFGGATTTVTGEAQIIGLDSTGRSTNETVSFSTTPSFGNLAWALISSVTVTVSSISSTSFANITLQLGTTNSIGLTNVITSTADVYKIVEGVTNQLVNSSVSISTTNNTVRFVTVPDGGREYWIWYRTKRSSP